MLSGGCPLGGSPLFNQSGSFLFMLSQGIFYEEGTIELSESNTSIGD